ncbi:hypothetical protein [Actinoplanes sp. NPDC049265]|uniref:hypothetical protein n=1 Tax=Actinoplanes sp. NPDC049265 TaxID=3363902 RepID=UPI0037223A74
MSPEDRFEELIAAMAGLGVTPPAGGRRFHSPALRYEGRVIAMLSGPSLAVKLPRDLVDELVFRGYGTHFAGLRGEPMREWFVLAPSSDVPWLELAKEALSHAQRTRA